MEIFFAKLHTPKLAWLALAVSKALNNPGYVKDMVTGFLTTMK